LRQIQTSKAFGMEIEDYRRGENAVDAEEIPAAVL
jgi:hypothetical protein